MSMRSGPRVVVAMSGGVDSSVAAALLAEGGYEVVGVTMHLWDYSRVGGDVNHQSGCCSPESINDARTVCHQIVIPHYVVDFRREFGQAVLDNFTEEYFHGRTPNPCVRCNTEIKWKALWRKARSLGADLIATGHYARIERDDGAGRWRLLKGIDPAKDQSYFLWDLDQATLAATLFPVGGLRKEEVRAIAARLGLKTAAKPESFEICFIPDHDYGRFLRRQVEDRGGAPSALGEGSILDREGRVVGRHRGAAFYTVGQRKGLGVALGRPAYVTRIEAERNILWVGDEDDLYADEMAVERVRWIAPEGADGPLRAEVRIRHRHTPAPATIAPGPGGTARVRFDEPQRAITPGQSAVFYRGDEVWGGGVIASGKEAVSIQPSAVR